MLVAEATHASTHFWGNASSYSPITLTPYWPRVNRLLFVFCCSVFGSVMNIFFISTFFVNSNIRRVGNVFLACAGLADLVITAAVMPIIAVVLLSGEWESLYLCKFLQFITQTASYAFSLNFAFVGAENYYRICRNINEYKSFLSMGIEVVAVSLIGVSLLVAGAGVYYDLDYDYCKREHQGNYHFKLFISIFLTMLPGFLVYGFLIIAIFVVQVRLRLHSRYRRSRLYGRSCELLASNLVAYTLYIVAWIPYFVIINKYPNTSDSNYYSSVWMGVIRSIVFGFSYGLIDRNYRKTYCQLFKYCCCKVELPNDFYENHRNRYYASPRRARREIRVHILQRRLAINPHRGNFNVQETSL